MGTEVGGLRWVESIEKTSGCCREVKGGERGAGWAQGRSCGKDHIQYEQKWAGYF